MAMGKKHILDDLNAVRNIDRSDMLGIIGRLPDHVQHALKIPTVDVDGFKHFKPELIAFLGMGGSAISGDIIASWLYDRIDIPVIVVRGYDIPRMIGPDSLVFAVSYSGNTEETLSAFEQSRARKAHIVAVSGGGLLADSAASAGVEHIKIKPLEPMAPRAAISYLLFPVINALNELGVLPDRGLERELDEVISVLKDITSQLNINCPNAKNQAKQIALKLRGYSPVVLSYRPYQSIAYRWCTQFNENSKILARCSELPEMNHNDIVGWAGDDRAKSLMAVILRDAATESPQLSRRLELTKKMALSNAGGVIAVQAAGKYLLSKMLSLMYTGDFASAYLAIARGVDPTPVNVIEKLKRELNRGKKAKQL